MKKRKTAMTDVVKHESLQIYYFSNKKNSLMINGILSSLDYFSNN